MNFDTKFGSIWLPAIGNLLYVRDGLGLVVGMEFSDRYDATAAYEEYVAGWGRTGPVNLTFVEGGTSYEVVCYQDPRRSPSKRGLCMYKDSLRREGLFLRHRERILESGCRVSVYYRDGSGYRRLGPPLPASARMVPEDGVPPGSYEDVIRGL